MNFTAYYVQFLRKEIDERLYYKVPSPPPLYAAPLSVALSSFCAPALRDVECARACVRQCERKVGGEEKGTGTVERCNNATTA